MSESSDASRIERQLAQIILNSANGEAVLPTIAQAVGEALRADRCWIVAREDRQPLLGIFSWAAGAGDPEAIGNLEPPGIAEWLGLTRSLAISDLQVDGLGSAGENLMTSGIRAVSIAPIFRQEQVIGAIAVGKLQPYTWSQSETERLEVLSVSVGLAIASKTLQQIQTLVEDRTSQLQSSLELQEKLYEKMRQQVAELHHLYEVKNQFVSDMSDRLKHPLTAMRIAIRLLRQPDLPIEKRNQYLDIIDRQCTEEINLIEDLLSLQRLDSKPTPLEWQNIDFKQTILDLTQSFEQKWSDRGLTLAVELPAVPVKLQTDINSLNRILLELLTNAGKYSDPKTTVYLRVTQQSNAGAKANEKPKHSRLNQHIPQLVLSICNTGFCIAEAELPHIFDRFVRSQAVIQPVRGTGLGLALVKSLVEYLHGQIDVSSCQIENSQSCKTCFTLTLPQFFDS
jgi:signal transduction histidine kinase